MKNKKTITLILLGIIISPFDKVKPPLWDIIESNVILLTSDVEIVVVAKMYLYFNISDSNFLLWTIPVLSIKISSSNFIDFKLYHEEALIYFPLCSNMYVCMYV